MKRAVKRNFDLSPDPYRAYEEGTGRFRTLADRLRERIDARRGSSPATVLDAGAGTGASSAAFEAGVERLVALDLSREMLRSNPVADRVQGDIETLPFDDDRFDAVAFTASLFLVPDPGAAVREAIRVLREGGVVAAVVMLGWTGADGTDVFAEFDVEPRAPTEPDAVADALRRHLSVETGVWSFETTADALRAFHETPAGSARLFPRDPPEDRIQRARELLADVEGPLRHRWRWFVGTTDRTDGG